MKDKNDATVQPRRSDKVEKILNTNLNGVQQWGMIIIIVVFIVIFAVVLSQDFPYGNGESIFSHYFRSHP